MHRLLVFAAVVWCAWTLPAAVHGACADPQRFSSVDYSSGPYFGPPTYIYTPGVQPYSAGTFSTITADFRGSFWALGAGDPAPRAGIDNGTFVGYAGYPYYGDPTWIYTSLDPIPASFTGNWAQNDGIDGCIDDVPWPRCMAVLLSDQFEGQGYFALATAAAEAHGDHDFTQEGQAIYLAQVPPPTILDTIREGGAIAIEVALAPLSGEGLYLDAPACTTAPIVGYKLYQQVVDAGTSPTDRERSGWQVALGGQRPGGEPIPLDESGVVIVSGCTGGGRLYLATSLVFDSGFETAHLSADSVPIDCGECANDDTDADGLPVGACTPKVSYDCDDDDPAIFPRAPQVCDGSNNDCLHPFWPLLAATNEVDADGDGVSACEGDPCPDDPDDDADADGLCAGSDNCPHEPNPAQRDSDGDGSGDPCDPCPLDPTDDADGDGLCADLDVCPLDAGNDADDDGVCDDLDNCAALSNPFQEESDLDGVGDVCDIFARGFELGSVSGSRGHVSTADIDGDGDVDVLGATFLRDIVWYRNDVGDGSVWSKQTITTDTQNATTVEAADLDGDGDQDVLFTAATATFTGPRAGVAWYENLGLGLAWELHALPIGTGGHSASAADLNGDGWLDVLAAQTDPFPDGEDFFFAFLNANGAGTNWIKRTIAANAGGAQSIVPADVNLDGRIDAVTASRYNDTIAWYENADPLWTRHVVSYDADGPQQVAAADVDGDGDLDVLSASSLDHTVAWYENPQLPTTRDSSLLWTTHTVSTELGDVQSVFAADLDLDGDVDVVSGGRRLGQPAVVWHENLDGAGGSWKLRGIDGVTSGVQHVHAADLDGDRDLEVLSAAAPWTLSYSNATCHDAERPPRSITGVQAGKLAPASLRLSWTPAPGATHYSITRGNLSTLSVGHYGTCVAVGLTATFHHDAQLPAAGDAWTYLVSGNSTACGQGGLGLDGQAALRVNADPGACPPADP